MICFQERKCFHFEQPRDTPIVFSYEILDAGHVVGFELYLSKNERQHDKLLISKTFDIASDHVDFVTESSGIFVYCVRQLKSDDKSTRFRIIVNYGFDDEYYEKLSEEQKYDPVNTELRKVNDLLLMTINEADYQKHKEIDYHHQTEIMNSAVLWWPMVQVCILFLFALSLF